MAELNKGFEPFSIYNAGNDYNPHGYGTATAMKFSADTLSALSAVSSGSIDHSGKCYGKYEVGVFDIITNVADERVNYHEFINGIWHATSAKNSGGVYQPPSITSFELNIPEFIPIENREIFDKILVVSKINPGSAESITTNIKIKAVDKEILLYTTTDSDINVALTDPQLVDIVNELIKNGITFEIVAEVNDGKSTIVDKKEITSVHVCYYGWMSKYDITPEIISQVDPSKGRCAKAIKYDLKHAYFGSFYPEDTNMYIAIPVDIGLVKSISNGAALYTVGTKNTDFIWSIININDINYYLYVLDYANHGAYNLCTYFIKENS